MKHVLILAILFMIVGCAAQTVTVTETTTHYAVMEDNWLVDCPTVPPPDQLVYTAGTLQQRIDMWTATYLEQARIQSECRIRSKAARDYNNLKRNETTVVTCSEGQCK